jgi:hypothetical protein
VWCPYFYLPQSGYCRSVTAVESALALSIITFHYWLRQKLSKISDLLHMNNVTLLQFVVFTQMQEFGIVRIKFLALVGHSCLLK